MSKSRDQLPFSDPTRSVQTGFQALSAIQHETPGHQVAGIAILFLEMVEGSGLDVSEVLSAARRIAATNDTFYQREVKALRDYVKGELA